MEYRPLEGFVLAITPFNFTSIAGNLPTAPALLGNVVVWKPSPTQQLSAHYLMRLLEAAGLPPGVINLVTGDGQAVSQVALTHPDLAGIHFTGSTATFQHLWRTVGENIAGYRNYPRLVGETGGKDFVIVHPSADPASCHHADPRRVRVPGPEVLGRLPRLRARGPSGTGPRRLIAQVESLTMGDVRRPVAVHGRRDRRPGVRQARRRARAGQEHRLGRRSWPAAQPTTTAGLLRAARPCSSATDPADEIFTTEYFGPILAVHVYPDADYRQMLPGRGRHAVRADRGDPGHRPPRSPRPPTCCGTRRATSTSTTSPPARSSASSRSAAPGPAAPTTRPARSST
jgi:1-pyrroline-5-carboxylate dehydrogenase